MPKAMAPVLALAVAACGGSSGTDLSSNPPTVSITSPSPGGTVTMNPSTKEAPLTFAVTQFTIAAPGNCSGPRCGHVHAVVDAGACNSGSLNYNSELDALSGNLKLALCATAAGGHTVFLELHDSAHAPILVNGAVVKSTSITFTTQ